MLLQVIKNYAPHKSAQKEALGDGFLVLHLHGHLAAPVDDADDQVHLWLHIGMHMFSPYEPIFQQMLPRERTADERGISDDLLALEGTGEFITFFKAIEEVDLSYDWSAQLYELWSGAFLLSEILPKNQLVIQPPKREEHFWSAAVQPRFDAAQRNAAEDAAGIGGAQAHDPSRPDGGEEAEDGGENFDLEGALEEVMVDEVHDDDDDWDQEMQALEEGLAVLAHDDEEAPPPGLGHPPAPPPPPPPPPPQVPREDGHHDNRSRAEYAIHFKNGMISFYSEGYFEARCLNHAGQQCKIRRTAKAVQSRVAAGRPLGTLAAFLADCPGEDATLHTGSLSRLATHGKRVLARAELAGMPAAQPLFERERALNDNEPEEPRQMA